AQAQGSCQPSSQPPQQAAELARYHQADHQAFSAAYPACRAGQPETRPETVTPENPCRAVQYHPPEQQRQTERRDFMIQCGLITCRQIYQ
ncbi:hypothetical protein K6U71_15265, partial [Vibrio alginolyticus]|nr:hypothetical protein [Vibrio alginolyticus]